MIIKHIKHKYIDKDKWDKAINNSVSPKIYALSWYLDIVSPGWDAVINESYGCVLPLTFKKKYGLARYLHIPFFTQQLGLFSKRRIAKEYLHLYLNKIPFCLRKDINLNSSNPHIENSQQKDNYILDLSNYNEVKSNYSTQIKRNIKKAENLNFQIIVNDDYQPIIDLFKSSKAKEIEFVDYSILEQLCEEAKKRKVLSVYNCTANGNLDCGIITFSYLDRMYLIMLAGSEESKNHGSSSLLIDYIIKENCDKGLTLDFEGSNISSLARFYKGFGSENEPYQFYSKRII